MAELLATAIKDATGIPGVMIRDIHLDPDEVITRLAALHRDGLDLRLAYLNPAAAAAASQAGLPTTSSALRSRPPNAGATQRTSMRSSS